MSFFNNPFEQDPFFNSRPSFMMDSMFDHHHHHHRRSQQLMAPRRDAMMSPFGSGMMMMDPFRHMESMMSNFHRMVEEGPSSGSGTSYSHSSVMQFSSSTGPDGKPQIYQASSSTRRGPGGIEESRKMERDSTSGVQKMSVKHQIGDRSHTVQKKVNVKTNEREENHELINIEEEEEQSFNREWDTKTRSLNYGLEAPRRPRGELRGLPMATSSTHSGRPHPEHSTGLPMATSSTHSGRPRPDHSPRVHPYHKESDEGKRKKKSNKVEFL